MEKNIKYGSRFQAIHLRVRKYELQNRGELPARCSLDRRGKSETDGPVPRDGLRGLSHARALGAPTAGGSRADRRRGVVASANLREVSLNGGVVRRDRERGANQAVASKAESEGYLRRVFNVSELAISGDPALVSEAAGSFVGVKEASRR